MMASHKLSPSMREFCDDTDDACDAYNLYELPWALRIKSAINVVPWKSPTPPVVPQIVSDQQLSSCCTLVVTRASSYPRRIYKVTPWKRNTNEDRIAWF